MRSRHIDWIGLAVRFTCGAAFGAVLGFFVAARDWNAHLLAITLAATALCGVLAAALGDAFWTSVADLFRSWG